MRSRGKKSNGKRRVKAGATPRPPKQARANESRVAKGDGASQRFVKDLLVRGEAAKTTKAGKLPLSATHVIVKENADGTVEVRRARYQAF